MTLEQIINAFRLMADDNVKPYLWSDEEIIEYVNRAQEEACRRSRLLIDSTTADVAIVGITAGEPLVALDSRVLSIRRARLAGRSVALAHRSVRDLDRSPGWEEHVGPPTAFITDYQTGALRLYPIPDADDDLQMTVVRLPLKVLENDSDEPEIGAPWHRALIDGALMYAYLKQDADAFDKDRAARYAEQFALNFGPPVAALDELWAAQHYNDLGEL